MDTGRKRGSGKVVCLYYDLCESIWAGSPATEQLSSGLETTDTEQGHLQPTSTDDTSTTSSLNSSMEDEQVRSKESTAALQSSDSTVQHRRELLGNKLNNYRQEKLKRKLPVDSQLLDCAKEDVQLKKKLIEQVTQMDQVHSRHMDRLSNNMEQLTNSITTGFSLLQDLLYSQQQYQQPNYSSGFRQRGGYSYAGLSASSSGHLSPLLPPYRPQDHPEYFDDTPPQ